MTAGKPSIRIGLRFNRRDAKLLRELAERAGRRELTEARKVFSDAADAARTGEPLIVLCSTPVEARLMAAGYTRYGVAEPVLESLESP